MAFGVVASELANAARPEQLLADGDWNEGCFCVRTKYLGQVWRCACSRELEPPTRTLCHVAKILKHPLAELEMRARTKEIRRAGISVVPLKVYLPKKPTIAIAR
jgi:hypothetical protein